MGSSGTRPTPTGCSGWERRAQPRGLSKKEKFGFFDVSGSQPSLSGGALLASTCCGKPNRRSGRSPTLQNPGQTRVFPMEGRPPCRPPAAGVVRGPFRNRNYVARFCRKRARPALGPAFAEASAGRQARATVKPCRDYIASMSKRTEPRSHERGYGLMRCDQAGGACGAHLLRWRGVLRNADL